ncbi:hypothetical protein [Arthrobacter sp. Leaf69]|uniref:hypothetical protein n=1 Tax=Arthrobacter sp. Leaf69 TaxID=1736232 RepID=UPI0006F91C92|nr:hypothetical protein [Arthrobacter sp. Leaf69]KQN88987.1 hypothetical protein ASE96_05005 [Arthrobacter sp. Leaf69]
MSGTSKQLAPPRRIHRIDTRFSEAELALVEKVATWRGLPPSAFVRGAALAAAKQAEGHSRDGATVPPPVVLTAVQLRVLDAARVDVRRVGVNLNQLSRLAHKRELDLGALAPVVDELAERYARMVSVLSGKECS